MAYPWKFVPDKPGDYGYRACGHQLHGYRTMPFVCDRPEGHDEDHGEATDSGQIVWNREGLIVAVKS